MKRLKSCLLASVGLVILAVTLSFTTPGRAFAQRVGEDCIRICDTASNPLHVIVQGITRVTGDVTINNQNAIATTVTGPVRVNTSPREPLHVIPRMKLDDIFQKSVSLEMADGQSEVSTTFSVPAGKLLVIGSASGNAWVGAVGGAGWSFTSQYPSVLIKTSTDNSASQHPLASTSPVFSDGSFIWNIGGLTLIYANPNTEIEVIFNRENTNAGKKGTALLHLTLSGHYLDAN